ncbi:MAG: mercuric transporter MerT family protein [Burkholderiales bacterium]
MEQTVANVMRDSARKGADVGPSASANVASTGGIIAGIAASICCIGPLVFVALGLGGAAAGLIAFFTPLRPVFIGLALLFLGFAAYRLFFVPRACAPGTACADPRTLRNQRLLFIGIAIVVAALLTFPWYATYLT